MLHKKYPLFTWRCYTCIGWFRAISDGKSLICLNWNQTGWTDIDRPDIVSRETIAQLKAYFDGQLRCFDLPLNPKGVSQSRCYWLDIMATIPYGTTITYAEFAAAAGHPKAARAAGTVCAINPVPIIYPCHRVLHKDGTLGRYGGGSILSPAHPENLERKAFLINHEALHIS